MPEVDRRYRHSVVQHKRWLWDGPALRCPVLRGFLALVDMTNLFRSCPHSSSDTPGVSGGEASSTTFCVIRVARRDSTGRWCREDRDRLPRRASSGVWIARAMTADAGCLSDPGGVTITEMWPRNVG